jgi:hypothetical protein
MKKKVFIMNINSKYFANQDSFLEYVINSHSKYLILVASSTIINLKNFNKQNIKIVGAIFSHIIYKNEAYDKGLISIEISEDMNLDFIENIKDYEFDANKFAKIKSIITIFNGFNENNEEFFIKLFENIPFDTNILGGGAGIIEDKNKKVFFNNDGFFLNSAIILSVNKKIKIASKHGWECLCGPYIVTSSEKNILKTIDYIDAFEIYQNEIKKDCNIYLTKDNFLDISKNYPIGIVRYLGLDIVRDPISFEEGKLVLVAEIRVNSIINILKGNKKSLINAAREAAQEVLDESSDLAVVFNCITRKSFLEEEFKDELDAIYTQISSNNMIGAVTIGEIANNGNRYINLLNKSCAIGGI